MNLPFVRFLFPVHLMKSQNSAEAAVLTLFHFTAAAARRRDDDAVVGSD